MSDKNNQHLTPQQEIDDLRSNPSLTLRPTVDRLEDILYSIFPVLDHGHIRVIDYMGNDDAVVQAARVSYGRGTKKGLSDAGLINYLMRHHHSTPFEMCEIKFHIKLPIFIARQWIRHRMASVNEYSARYSILSREFYLPSPEALARQSASNKQGKGDVLDHETAEEVLNILKADAEHCYGSYEKLLDPDGIGLARELARINLTLNTYTEWYWKIDLHNFMNFLRLRADSHAQAEIAAYANILIHIMERWVPQTSNAFREHRLNSFVLSATMIKVVRRIASGEAVNQENSGLSKRDWNDLMTNVLENPA